MKHFLSYLKEVTLAKWDEPALSDYKGQDYSYRALAGELKKIHFAYKNLNLNPGDKVAICGQNSARLAMAFLATSTYYAVTVPILYDFTPEAILRLTDHSESVILFTDERVFSAIDPRQAEHLKAVVSLRSFTCLWAREPEYARAFSDAEAEFSRSYPHGLSREDVDIEPGAPGDLTVINYTSGTTGQPKGVMLSARSLSANVNYALEAIRVTYEDRSLSMLPMAHMFGLTFEFLYPLCGGSHVFFLGKTPGPSTLMAAFADVRPYILITVPLVMEKIVKGKILPVLDKPAVRVLTHIPGIREILYRILRGKLLEAFGGKVREIPMGGAALNPSVEEVLRKMRMPYAVGYGMTECGPLISYRPWNRFRPGTCGASLPGYNEVRIASPDPERIVGEVQVRGMVVMDGYFKNEEATRASFTEDGWLKTGDLGIIDRHGAISLKGRSKCMILGSNGQNIYPEEIEAVANSLPEVGESLVVSRGGKIVALVALADGAGTVSADALKNRINSVLPLYSQLSRLELMKDAFVHTPKHSIKRSLYTDMNA
ncbi:MAG: AMP-binding protein [Bacteroidales bacterium]|nr:AMP-binding protein [Bacteroidales bacterium]